MVAIVTRELAKEFDGLLAVEALTLEAQEGEIFGLAGSNGAGKTTTLLMLATLLKPTRGHARINGFDVVKEPDRVRQSIGMVFQEPSLDLQLTAWENLDFHGRLYHLPKELRQRRIREMLELVELSDRTGETPATFSLGMRRRLELARGLLHHPKVLFLDEPTLGLDPRARQTIWDYIKELNRTEKVTVVVATNYMEEAEYLCDRIAIIDQGKLITQGAPEALKDTIKAGVGAERPTLQEVFIRYTGGHLSDDD